MEEEDETKRMRIRGGHVEGATRRGIREAVTQKTKDEAEDELCKNTKV